MPGPLTLAFEIYRAGVGRVHLVVSAHPQHARIHLSHAAPSRDPEQHPPLLLLLRKHVRGGIISEVQQPPFERVLRISIDKRLPPDKHQEYHFGWDFGNSGTAKSRGEGAPDEGGTEDAEHPGMPVSTVHLYVEIMGRLSNAVLVNSDGIILDAIKRIPPALNRYRTTLPHQPYVLPPPQDKRDPSRVTPNALSVMLDDATADDPSAPAWKGLVSGLLGVSPPLAREAVHRAFGDTSARADAVAGRPAELASLLKAVQPLLSPALGEAPTTAWREGEEGETRALDFAPYRLTHLEASAAALREHATMSEAVETFFDAASKERFEGHAAYKGQVRAEIDGMLARERRKLRALEEEMERSRALETLRTKGEMILAYMHTLEPGQTVLEVEGVDFKIALDPALTPVENSQAYFREYRKAQSAQAGLPERIEAARADVDFWDGLLTSLELASGYDEIRAVAGEIAAARTQNALAPEKETQRKGKKPGKGDRGAKIPQPLRLRTKLGAHLLVGRTASQNDTATFRLASPEDLWLHARGVPGAHVILRAESGYTEADLEEAASIAAAYSKLRNEQYVDVIVTERRHVRRIPNGPPGAATFRNERVVRVQPAVPTTLALGRR
jgi:predicted ribosome quality control (RQC) complex YloA/Tae2 family protein